jgi:hypothetical protein
MLELIAVKPERELKDLFCPRDEDERRSRKRAEE